MLDRKLHVSCLNTCVSCALCQRLLAHFQSKVLHATIVESQMRCPALKGSFRGSSRRRICHAYVFSVTFTSIAVLGGRLKLEALFNHYAI